MDAQVPKKVVQDRYDRLVALVEDVAWAENRAHVGTQVEVLVAVGEGRKDAATGRVSGRARDNRLVHVDLPPEWDAPRPGDLLCATVTQAAPHHLIAAASGLRRTSAGDVWEAQNRAGESVAGTGGPDAAVEPSTFLGLPSRGLPSRGLPSRGLPARTLPDIGAPAVG
jgi:tRNA-2-methylthio-N6-dimethylallyladenosine synthase